MQTGPLGRLARLILALVAIVSFASIVDQGGPASFRGQQNLAEPSLLVLDAVMLVLFGSLVRIYARSRPGRDPARRSPALALVAVAIAVGLAAIASQVVHRTVWDSPLSDLVWWFDTVMLLETIAALLLAVVIGLPGCEIGVWPFLIGRARGERGPMRPVGCVAGLHLIDEWEAARPRTR